jgi:hypothetical protein
MSRGWESKSVEQQQAQQQAEQQAQQPGEPSKVEQKAATADAQLQEAERKRKVQALQLQRERVLSERTSSPHRRTALTNALADIEEKLTELGWTIHL